MKRVVGSEGWGWVRSGGVGGGKREEGRESVWGRGGWGPFFPKPILRGKGLYNGFRPSKKNWGEKKRTLDPHLRVRGGKVIMQSSRDLSVRFEGWENGGLPSCSGAGVS